MLRDIYVNETVSRDPVFDWDKILLAVEHMCRTIDKHHICQRKHRKSSKLRRLRVRMVAEMVKINKGSIREILIEDIQIWKLRARIFPEVPTHDQNMNCQHLHAHFWTVSSEPRVLAWPSYLEGTQPPYPPIMWMVEPHGSCGRLGDKFLVTVGYLKANPRTTACSLAAIPRYPRHNLKATQYDAF